MNTSYGPFAPPDAPANRYPVAVEVRDGIPQIAWQDAQTQAQLTYRELYLPPGWFYACRTNNGQVESLNIWCTSGLPDAVAKHGDSLVVDIPDFGRIPLQLDGHLAMRTQTGWLNAMDVVPSGLLLVDTNAQTLPQTCCKVEWLGALNLSKCQVTRTGESVRCILGFANGGELQHSANLKLKSLTNADGDSSRPPTLWVWPRQIQQGWQIYRCLADLKVLGTNDLKRLCAIPYARVQSANAAWLIRCNDMSERKTSELVGGLSLQARSGFLLPTNLPPDVQITSLCWHIEATIEADVFVGVHAAGTECMPNVVPAQGSAGQAKIAMDFGTSTTVLACQVETTTGGNEAGVFKIDARDRFWEPASLAPISRNDRGCITIKDEVPWLPWLRQTDERNDAAITEQFSSRLLVRKVEQGDSADGRFNMVLVNRAGELIITLPGTEAQMATNGWYLTSPGSMKWSSHRNDLIRVCRESYMEQLLLFCVSSLRNKQPGLQRITLVVSAPAAFTDEHRRSYQLSLERVVERIRKWTGIAVTREKTATQPQIFHDESRPVLREAINVTAMGSPSTDPRDGSVTLPVVVVADLGGETFDFGVYVCFAKGNYLELYNQSYRAAGYGVLKRVSKYVVQARDENAADDAAKVAQIRLDDKIRNEGLGFFNDGATAKGGSNDNSFFVQNAQLEARNEVIGLIVSLLLSLRAIVDSVQPDLEGIIDDLRKETRATEHWKPGEGGGNVTWITAGAPLLKMVGSSSGPAASTAVAGTKPVAPVARPATAMTVSANVLESLRAKVDQLAGLGINEIKTATLAQWLDELDHAAPEPTRAAPAMAAPVVADSASPKSGNVRLDVQFYLAGNGWRLYGAAPKGAPALGELMETTMERLGMPAYVHEGKKSDCARGLVTDHAQSLVIWRHVRNNEPVSRAPHGARLKDPQAPLPSVYTETLADQSAYAAILAPQVARLRANEQLLDIAGFEDMEQLYGDLFGSQPCTWLENLLRVLAGQESHNALNTLRSNGGLTGPLMKSVLEAVYRSDSGGN
jgi:hypothetical protein